ncbi:unnamed protein product [Schistosoma mattheei]|uniref:BTB domain-containing protein n=1 Tax=Schistosoma mattheei TaxID=31246 RepID=A0AA85B6K2_9TREM|nr:unnamed protein product [Schistosoma mattheei]
MASGMITLIAENQSFLVPRDVLTKSSLYFYAAFESGMTESKTSQFSFPNFTAHQLAMVVQFLRPELIIRDDALNNHSSGLNNSCPETLKILEALDLADAADYFQMPKLIQTLKPRAESLCLLGLAPSRSSNSLEFWLFNLHNGAYHNYPIPDNCLRELDLDSSGVGDIDHRIYFCPVTYGSGSYQSNLFVMCFDPNNATLNGFAWCLASCRAKLIPRLLLSPTNNRNGTINSFCFRSRRIGVTTLSSGLYMYYLSCIQEVAWLCAFRFDLSTWNWYGIEPYCLSRNQNGMMLFTPIEQLNSIPPDDWVYANIETVSSNNSRHPRHGLHQTSALRSQFFRFRPRPDGDALFVENLPNPPFLIRMYRLLAISCSLQGNFSDKTYLFPMGTCSRDLEATHYCFDTFSCQWLRWKPVQTSDIDELNPIRQHPSEDIELTFNLCPKILGFRGLVCATHILNRLDENKLLLSRETYVQNPDGVKSNDHPLSSSVNDSSYNGSLNSTNKNRLTTLLVLAGRPDQTKHVTSGIWFHHPQACNSSDETIALFNSQKPNYFLPTAIAQTLDNTFPQQQLYWLTGHILYNL